eukprot:76366-Pelagomonas_calceolata.AAC.1
MNVPAMRRNLSRIKVGRSAWDRAQKDSTRAAFDARQRIQYHEGNPVSIVTTDDSYLPLLRASTQELRPTWCLSVCTPFIVGRRHLSAI